MTDTHTFDTFYRGTVRRLTRYAFGLTGDAAEAQDLAQEAYARAWQRWRRLRGYDDAEAWLRTVVNRLATDRWRRLRVRRHAAASASPVPAVSPPSEETIVLVAALRELPWEQRQVLLLHHFLDRSVAEIAEETGTNVNTVKSRLARGRTALARELTVDTSADALAPDAPEAARRRGRARNLRAATGAALCVLLVTAAVAYAVHGRSGRFVPPPTTTTPSPTISSQAAKFAHVGSTVPIPGDLAFGTVAVVGDRAFVSHQDGGGKLSVTAIDVASGAKLWGPVTVATFDDAGYVLWHPRVALVMGRHDNGTRPDGTIFSLDPKTGHQRLKVDVDSFEADDIVVGETTLVVASRSDRTTRGYDLLTGAAKWSVPDPADSPIVHSLPMESSRNSDTASLQSTTQVNVTLAEGQFVQLTANGAALLRDLNTGRQIGRFPGAVSPAGPDLEHDEVVAIDGVLYAATPHRHANRITGTGLIELPDPPLTFYEATAGEIFSLTNCHGTNGAWLCFREGSPTSATSQVVLLDGRQVRWRVESDARTITGAAGSVLLGSTGRDGDQRSTVLNSTGGEMLREEARTGSAFFNWGDRVLIFQRAGTGLRILGAHPLDAPPVEIGVVPGASACGWADQNLVCLGPDGISDWSYPDSNPTMPN